MTEHAAAPDSTAHWMTTERMALGSPSEIAKDSSRAIGPVPQGYEPRDDAEPQSVSSIAALVSSTGVTEDVVRGAMQWLDQGSTQNEAELARLDEAHSTEVRAELQALWGDKYHENRNAIEAYVRQVLPPDAAAAVMNARMPDGRAILNDAANLQRMLPMARAPRPQSEDPASEIKSIEAFMRTNRSSYTKDEVMQARYRELLRMRGAR